MSIFSLNQNRLTLASGYLAFQGRQFFGVQSITPSEEVKSELVYGSGQIAQGKTRGQLTGAFAFEILIGEGDALVQALGTPLSNSPFDFSGSFIEAGSTEPNYTLGATQLTIKKIEIGISNDGKPLTYKIDCLVIDPISWNGVYLVDIPEGDEGSFGLTLLF